MKIDYSSVIQTFLALGAGVVIERVISFVISRGYFQKSAALDESAVNMNWMLSSIILLLL